MRHRMAAGIVPILLLVLLSSLTLTSEALAQGLFGQQKDFLPPDQAFQPTLNQDGQALTIDWQIEPGYYLYRHRLAVEAEGRELPLDLPAGETIEDEYFGRSEVYRNALSMQATLGGEDSITLSWQGCADAGLCYPPQQQTFELETAEASNAGDMGAADTGMARSVSSSASVSEELAAANGQAEDQRLAARLSDGNAIWTLALFFGMGLLLTFTPCVLPMIPILSSLIIGQQQQGDTRRSAGLMLSLAYVLPMAVTYAAIGVAAALAGANLQMLFQNVWFISLFSVLFVLLALAMFGLFELQLPSAIRQRLDAGLARQRGGRMKGVAIMGVLSALLVGPCMTAPLAGALLFIAESGNPWLGGAALLALGLGMGAPLILIGTVGNRLLPKPGAWMGRVRGVFGFVLLGMAIWFAERTLPDPIVLGLWGALGLGFAVALRALARSAAAGPLPQAANASAVIIGLWCALILIGAAGGAENPWRPLDVYAPSGAAPSVTSRSPQPLEFVEVNDLTSLQTLVEEPKNNAPMTLVEFTAEWCVSCEVIEHEVFGDPSVQAELRDVQRLSVDVTEYDAEDKAIMQQYGVVGPPTLMWFGPEGEERRGERIIGELDPTAFLKHYERARQTPGSGREDEA
ncbi:protein-disulfide reductase DsbD [Billgrantia antri]|uniref:protein-disulfide reductase DsbD n=1 Tax=Billgrantia antri TaxID=2846777 RepID=UPI003B22349C